MIMKNKTNIILDWSGGSLLQEFSAYLNNVIFLIGIGTSTFLEFLSSHIKNSIFIGKGTAKYSSAFMFSNVINVVIEESYFSSFMGLSAIANLNQEISYKSIFSFKQNLFKDSFCEQTNISNDISRGSGCFFYSKGLSRLNIDSCIFLNGSAQNNGGAIAFFCLGASCFISLNGSTIFSNNKASGQGQSIFSPTNTIMIGENVMFIGSGNTLITIKLRFHVSLFNFLKL